MRGAEGQICPFGRPLPFSAKTAHWRYFGAL